MNIFAQITKIDAAKREVHGVIAEEAADKAGEIFDYASSKPYVKEWSDDAVSKTLLAGQEVSYGNVRSQHNPKIAAGKLVSIDFDDQNRKIPVIARIVDDGEWNKVQEGVYTGFSIGGDYVKRWTDPMTGHIRYTARPKEVSIVDSPCMAGATFTMVKTDGATEQRHFHSTDPFNPNDLGGELRKSLANRLTSAELEEKQARSARFVPRFNPHPGPDAPWL